MKQQPEWITQPLTPRDIASINQGGCASGAYMPAVTYYDAAQTMSEYGDDVFDYIESNLGELPNPSSSPLFNGSWSGLACFYLSYAGELFCASHAHLADWEDDDDCGLFHE